MDGLIDIHREFEKIDSKKNITDEDVEVLRTLLSYTKKLLREWYKTLKRESVCDNAKCSEAREDKICSSCRYFILYESIENRIKIFARNNGK